MISFLSYNAIKNVNEDLIKDGLQLSHSGILLFILRDITLLLLL